MISDRREDETHSLSTEYKEIILKTYKRWWKNYRVILFAPLVFAIVIRLFLFAPYYIPSSSMEPTLMINDRIVVNKVIYDFRDPHRGDIVVFYYPGDPNGDIKYIKRVIGLPGETVAIKDNKVYINNKVLSESYIPTNITVPNFGPKVISKGSYFVMGDNRNASQDSRVWGLLDKKLVIGKATMVFWPLNRIKVFKI